MELLWFPNYWWGTTETVALDSVTRSLTKKEPNSYVKEKPKICFKFVPNHSKMGKEVAVKCTGYI